MAEHRSLLEREMARIELRPFTLEGFHRRREQKERNRRISAAIVGIAIALLILTSLTWVLRSAERPAVEPTPPKPRGIFSEVGGWIVYGHDKGTSRIWAVNPVPSDPMDQFRLGRGTGWPVAWSSDGSKLLILRRDTERAPHQGFFGANLSVLNADGTETRLTEGDAWITGGSFSPDGSKVVYASDPGIFAVNAAGGRPQVLLTRTGLEAPTFSPDGSKIAYFAWDGRDRAHLRVMNADGSGSRVLSHDVFEDTGHELGLVWSPDGTRLAIDYGGDIYTVRADGSDLTMVIPYGGSPNWSPDGSRIAYDSEDVTYPPGPHLETADADGKNTLRFGNARSGPWNPLVQPGPEIAEAPDAGGVATLASILLPVAALLTLVVGSVLIRRRRRAPGA